MAKDKEHRPEAPARYTIGEIARRYNISSDALRYYEDMGLIKPLRSSNGYRCYTDRDMWKLNVINELRELGFSIDRIRAYLTEGTIDSTLKLLEEEQAAVDIRLKKMQQISARIKENINVINSAKQLKMDEISVKHFSDRPVMRVDADFSKDEEMDRLMKALTDDSEDGTGIIGNPHIAAVLAPMERPEPVYCGAVMLRQDGTDTIPEGDYLSVCYSGEWNSRAYARKLISYADEHGMELEGEFIDIVWIDIHTAIRVSDHISEVQVRIKDASP